MIPNVSRNSDASVLTAYLVGPGRTDEHLNPHLVSGSPHLMAWYSDAELSHWDALDLGGELNSAARVLGVDIPAGHIWHCSLSLHDQDGVRSDEEWETIAGEFMRDMGFIGQEGKADVTWLAVRHGLSGQNGNDHIHIAASVVRPDGTKVDTYDDWPRSQKTARVLEQKHKLLPVVEGHGVAGYTKAEYLAAERRGRVEPERQTVARMVRGYAAASETEGEFVRRCRRGGLVMKPTFASTEMREVIGYSAGLKPPKGFRPTTIQGHKLGKDLGLGMLRESWLTPPGSDTEALSEWQAAKFGKRPVVDTGRESRELDPETYDRVSDQLADLRARLRDVPFGETGEWRQVASFLAGSYASWSIHTEPVPGPIARVADELAKSAQVHHSVYQRPGNPRAMSLYSATALALAAQGSGPGAALAVFVHMSKLTEQILKYNVARADKVRELSMLKVAQADLRVLSERMHTAAGKKTSRAVRPGTGIAPTQVEGPVIAAPLAARKTTGPRVSR